MRRFMSRAAAVAVAVMGAVLVHPSTATAETTCQVTDPQTGSCVIWIEVPGSPSDPTNQGDDGPKDTGSGGGCFWDPGKQGLSSPPAGPVPCNSPAGYWSNAYNCYIKSATPQPPAGDPVWQGHEPGDGAIYSCYQPQTGILITVWAADPPGNSGSGPTPREVAELAIDEMALRAIDIGIAPEPGPGSVGLVGMPVWLWARDPDAHSVGPTSASASAGGLTIAATARLHRIVWDLGDGTEVICRTAGTPYHPSFGRQASPDCGHIYAKASSHQPDGVYTVTASSDWVITWAGAGQTGTIRLNGLVRSVQITAGEAQVLVS